MKKILSFLSDLVWNNNKLWFDDHKSFYLEAQAEFNAFVGNLISGLGKFDPAIRNLEVKDCVYRIYRDIRFSHDKTPYKNHMGAFIVPGGKKSGHAGYYFHIEPRKAEYLGGHILCAGTYRPAPEALKSIREEISINGTNFEESIHAATGFNIDFDRSLKRLPAGFSVESEYQDYIKLRDFLLVKRIDDSYLLNENLLENTLNEFKKTIVFNSILNRAIDY